jgi:SAM-dependent methyltransferase
MIRPAPAGIVPLDETRLGPLLSGGNGPIRLIGAHLHTLAVRLIVDGLAVEASVPARRDARAVRRALRKAGQRGAVTPVVGSLGIDLPFADSSLEAIVCRLDPQTFPFPRHTVRELGRAVAPAGTVVLLTGAGVPWPAGLVDAWAVSAGLAPRVERGVGGALPFGGAVYESRG